MPSYNELTNEDLRWQLTRKDVMDLLLFFLGVNDPINDERERDGEHRSVTMYNKRVYYESVLTRTKLLADTPRELKQLESIRDSPVLSLKKNVPLANGAGRAHRYAGAWRVRLRADLPCTYAQAVNAQRGRLPDVTMFFAPGFIPPRHGLISVPPDVAVEVISPSPQDHKRDRIDKLREYAAFGVRYYWLVDPEARLVEVFELNADGRYAIAASGADGSLLVPGCEGLTLNLDELWAEADRLAPDVAL